MNVVDLLRDLIRFPTQQGGGTERPLCEYVAGLLRADEVVVEDATRSDGTPGAYVFARWGTPARVINAHVDTVPANAGWSRSPWEPAVVGDRLYGLGAADTKGAIAATLCALDGHAPQDRGVLFSGDEEAGSGAMHAFLKSRHAAGIREVIVCEPSARRAGIAHRGVLAQTATLAGPGGHSSKADHLPKPLATLARMAVALDELGVSLVGSGPTGMTGTCLNIAALHGGVAFNVIAGRAELEWSLRPYPGFDRAAWDAAVSHLAPAGATLATTLDHAAFEDASLAPLVAPFVREAGPLDYWTEAAMWQAHGVAAIVIGPGDIAQAHSADEFVPLADLDWAVELYRALLS
ncbi:MAG TPA: M20/M25/M40 family metallo-hydrolase [Kofleriaceae bacterium]|jgi:acetylornithine deacetylase